MLISSVQRIDSVMHQYISSFPYSNFGILDDDPLDTDDSLEETGG